MEGYPVLGLTCKVRHSQLHSRLYSQLLLLLLLPLGTSISLLGPHIPSPPAYVSSLLADLVFDAPWALSKLVENIRDGSAT